MRLNDLFRLASEDLSTRWAYSLIIIAMLAVGIGTAFVSISQSQGVIAKEEELFQFLRPNLLIVYSSGPITGAEVNVIKSMKYVSAVYPVINRTVTIEVDSMNFTFYLLGVDNLSVITTYKVIAGTAFDYSGLLIPSSAPVHLAPGALIKVYVGHDAKYSYIAGVISYSHTVFQRQGVASSTLLPSYDCAFTSLQYAEELTGAKNFSFLFVITQSAKYNQEVEKEIGSVLPNTTFESLGVSTETIAKQYASFSAYLGSLSVVAILSSTITNGSVMAINFNRRLREVGVMMALGMRRPDLATLFLVEGLALGLAGGLLGLTAGFYATENVRLTDAVTYYPVIYPYQLLELVALSLVASTAGSIYPIVRVVRLTPTEVMR